MKVGGIVAAFEYFAGLSRKADAGVDAGFRLVEGDAEPSAAYVDAERCDGRLGREVNFPLKTSFIRYSSSRAPV